MILPQAGQVGLDVEQVLNRSVLQTEAGDDLVED